MQQDTKYVLCVSCFGLVQFLPSVWLVDSSDDTRPKSRRLSTQRPGRTTCLCVFFGSVYCVTICFPPALNNIFPTPMAWH